MAQTEPFKALLEDIAARPQDYVSDHGRLTTNTVEGFHGLALMYRGKRTDLGHVHYVCKTNMAICHKVSSCKLQHINYSMIKINTLTEPGSCVEGIGSCPHGCRHPG